MEEVEVSQVNPKPEEACEAHRSWTPWVAVLTSLSLMIVVGCGTDTEEALAAEEMAAAEGAVDLASLEPTGLPSPFMVHRNWGVLPEGRTWGQVSGVGVDPTGETGLGLRAVWG